MDAKDIKMLPGFKILDHTPGHTDILVPSGYKLRIRRLGPHTFRVLETREDLIDPGPFKIKVRLMEHTMPDKKLEEVLIYEPPTNDAGVPECPDKEKHEKAWVYYQQWISHNTKRQEIARKKDTLRNDMFLLNSIRILDGPESYEDEDWCIRLSHLLPAQPVTMSERLLLFIQTQVVTTNHTAQVIRELATVEEVTVEGLKKAFDMFWSKVTG